MGNQISKKTSQDAKKTARAPRSDDATAFLPDPFAKKPRHTMNANEPVAELVGEEFVASATSGEGVGEDVRDAVTAEELGGPFVASDARREFARSEDSMNPPEAPREAFPTATRSRD